MRTKESLKIFIVTFSKPLRCVQRKPLTAEVSNFTKRLGEKVLTIYHRKSLFKDKSSNTILDFLDKFFFRMTNLTLTSNI